MDSPACLMDIASNNSFAGIGEGLEAITHYKHLQNGKTPLKSSEHLQVMEGDLGTYCNLESLRALQRPTNHPEESISNNFMLLGASHTLWNVFQAIFLLHHGDSSNMEDVGAWHTLESLGFPADRPVRAPTLVSVNPLDKRVYRAILHIHNSRALFRAR
ncbi:hypothetical protein PCASD_07803 [Puccinia coronata f. sp. avenae]|uniref:DUF6589 domain-containing protein n=1 Tax=Puccinia coronata f. sp. avenae TaxID=200324 RepID=A0A2N5US47_9BASI|nr:hypothetical protein PCASD_07803 [Puccinia coronata f. sp. avenae]